MNKDARVRFGILGCGTIARNAIAPAIRWSQNARLCAIASREQAVATSLCRALGVEHAYAPYQALLEDPAIDAIYIGLPNGLHEEWTLRALEAGKHVLCEKSLALTAASARKMEDAADARKLRLAEAFMYRHHPQWAVVHGLLAERAIGDIRAIRASLGGRAAPGDHRWSATLGGGALYDVTCYAVDAARFLVGVEPVRVTALANLRTPEGVDASSHALMELPGGVIASASGSLESAPDQHLTVTGSEGQIEVKRPFDTGWDPVEIFVQRGHERRRIEIPGANAFLHQIEHFSRQILERDAPRHDRSVTLNVRACEAIARSFHTLQAQAV